jgi:uncharacterized protein YjbI with pentapeptide repeats
LAGIEQKPTPEDGRPLPDDDQVDWPAPIATKSLPEIARKADDLEAIKQAVDDAASVSGALWFSYLFVVFYLAVAAGAVTHADLFLENPVKLPFLGVELPLLAFFFVAPILFIVVHAYVLVHLVMLTDKAKRFHNELHIQIAGKTGLSDQYAKNIRDEIRRQLPSNVFVQFLAGAPETSEGPFGQALRAIGWTTLVVGPILLLLLMQVQFLPYHNRVVTWTQRLALLGDLALIWWLWGRILSGRDLEVGSLTIWPSTAKFLGWAALIFSWLVAVFPGEWQGDLPTQRLTGLIFQSEIDPTGHRWLSFSNTLILVGFDIYENLKVDDPDKLKRNSTFHALGRDLIGANFTRANLTKIDFAGAHLEGARLDGANLLGTQLGCNLADRGSACAHFHGASLKVAQLQGATLDWSDMQGASLDEADLQGASFVHARLRGASFASAKLLGASLKHAELQGASLDRAQLEGASLENAELLGASLQGARLKGASLVGAQLQGASLFATELLAADLTKTYLWRAILSGNASKIKFTESDDTWRPVTVAVDGSNSKPWDEDAYIRLSGVSDSFPPDARKRFQTNIQRLDCASKDRSLSPCDVSQTEHSEWQKILQKIQVPDQDYENGLSKILRTLACSDDPNAIWALRGVGLQSRLSAAGVEGAKLIDIITNKNSTDCPGSAAMTEVDKAGLRHLKKDAVEYAEP